jgi:hydroxymethylbilane synthase
LITIGSRGSQLALWQSRWVESRLSELGETCRIEIIKTTGDKITDVPLAKVGTKGLFTKEIEEALLAGTVDVAVHSLKDMPTELPAGLVLQAVPEREDVRDALIGRQLEELPAGARVGTSSLRRSAQLRAVRPDLVIETIRGNLDTRLRKLDEGQFDAIVLAAAGLRRLGWAGRIAELLPEEIVCPAAGQGALAIETRDDEGAGAQVARKLNHHESRTCVEAERAVLAALGGGCQVPIGANAKITGGRLFLRGVIAAPDGGRLIRGTREGATSDAVRIGADLAHELLANGGRAILDAVYSASRTPANPSLP